MSLTLLAPDIQEALLCLPATDGGCGAVSEHVVGGICAVADWREQRRMWHPLLCSGARCVDTRTRPHCGPALTGFNRSELATTGGLDARRLAG